MQLDKGRTLNAVVISLHLKREGPQEQEKSNRKIKLQTRLVLSLHMSSKGIINLTGVVDIVAHFITVNEQSQSNRYSLSIIAPAMSQNLL